MIVIFLFEIVLLCLNPASYAEFFYSVSELSLVQ
jgi:hypothetical protein